MLDIKNMNIDVSTLQQSTEDIEQAAADLFGECMISFETMKERPWYKTIIASFSGSDKKEVLKSIRTVANMQNMFIQLYYNHQISNDREYEEIYKVINCFKDKIEAIISLQDRINHQIKLRDSLNMRDQEILLGLLKIISNCPLYQDEMRMKEFNAVIVKSLDAEIPDNTFSVEYVRKTEKPEIINRVVNEQLLFSGIDKNDLPSGIQEYLDELRISNAESKRIEQNIHSEVNMCGIDILIEKYQIQVLDNEEYDTDIEDKTAEEIGPSESDSEVDTLPERKSYELDSIVQVAEGETTSFSNKIIMLNSFVECRGNIVFTNCEIHYGGDDCSGMITLYDNGGIGVYSSTIICHAENHKSLISMSDNGGVANALDFQDNYFIDCEDFAHCRTKNFIFANNVGFDCKSNLFYVEEANESCTIKENSFIYNKITDPSSSGNLTLFEFYSVHNLIFDNNLFDNHADKENIDDAKRNKPWNLIKFESCENAKVTNCSFNNLESCVLNACSIVNCLFRCCSFAIDTSFFTKRCADIQRSCFIKCKNAICNSECIESCVFVDCKSVITGVKKEITSSNFINCTDIVKITDTCKVDYCEFNNCYGRIIHTDSRDANVRIVSCKFDHIYARSTNPFYFAAIPERELAYRYNVIERCVFNNVDISFEKRMCIANNDAYLIHVGLYENRKHPTVYLKDCTFANITTSADCLINENSVYAGAFGKLKTCKSIQCSGNTGLERVMCKTEVSTNANANVHHLDPEIDISAYGCNHHTENNSIKDNLIEQYVRNGRLKSYSSNYAIEYEAVMRKIEEDSIFA